MSRPWTRAAAGMGAVTALSRGFGFVRVLVVAAVLGTTALGNAFQASNSVSNAVFELVAAGALSAVLVPSFVVLLDRGDHEEADRLASGVLGVATAVLGALSVVGVLGAPLLARLLVVGVDDPQTAAAQREVTTFLLRFFVPQLVCYGFATVATALLYARRRFAVTAAAPIGNTVVMVGVLAVFRAVAGPEPGLALSTGEQLLLALAGTGGVVAYAGVLVAAARRCGFRLLPRRPRRDPQLARLLRHAGWGIALHANAGLLLGVALVVGSSVAGGVVAYQFAFVCFLAPYAVFAQPIHTAILPELTDRAARGERVEFADAVRDALERMALIVVPVSAAMVAFAEPAMRLVAIGASSGGVDLFAAALAALGLGLFPYGAMLLLARACYALGDSRTPALVSIAAGVAGAAVMVALGMAAEGAATVAALGIGHTVSYVIGAAALGVVCARRQGASLWPRRAAGAVALSVPLALAGWAVSGAVGPSGRIGVAALLAVALAVLGGAYVLLARRWLRAAPHRAVVP